MTWKWRPEKAVAPPGGDTLIKSAKGLKPWPYLKNNPTKIDTLFKAQIRKMTAYARQEQKLKTAKDYPPRKNKPF